MVSHKQLHFEFEQMKSPSGLQQVHNAVIVITKSVVSVNWQTDFAASLGVSSSVS